MRGLSPPTRGRGLKRQSVNSLVIQASVAPYTGARIETNTTTSGVRQSVSPPTRGRGLKPPEREHQGEVRESPPTRGRGLKQGVNITNAIARTRRPLHGGAD